jgi:hypothetical protein
MVRPQYAVLPRFDGGVNQGARAAVEAVTDMLLDAA